MAVAGLYRRILPSPPAIEFASDDGKHLFTEALQNGTMAGFLRLISYFQTQSEPAYCGLASLCVVHNALSIDPGRKWKVCMVKPNIKDQSNPKVACLAHCAGAKVEARYQMHQIGRLPWIASYHRRPFKQLRSMKR